MSRRRRPGLALLTVHPVTATDVPRFHFHSPLADGSVMVEDRILRARYLVYTAKTAAQFESGHRGQLWYVRPVASDPVNEPRSPAFGEFAEAAQALRDGTWNLLGSYADRRPIRIIWGPPR